MNGFKKEKSRIYRLKIPFDTVYTSVSSSIGDYNNDVAMLKRAGVGIAVSNASPAALKAADYVTVSNEDHAIARVISDLENGKFGI